jgi:hypothetical protein
VRSCKRTTFRHAIEVSTRHDEIFEQAQQLQSYDKTDQVGFMIYIIMASMFFELFSLFCIVVMFFPYFVQGHAERAVRSALENAQVSARQHILLCCSHSLQLHVQFSEGHWRFGRQVPLVH